ncbi:MAG: DUF6436 domain-containing protein [Steroidobacteraceae bacterium]
MVRAWVPWVVAAAWLGATSAALWRFDAVGREAGLMDVPSPAALAAAERWFERQPSSSSPTVVHLIDPDCDCTDTRRHVRQIETGYAARGVRFIDARDIAGVRGTGPVAVVFDREGKAAYLGPYSTAAWCGSQGGKVEGVLERLLRDRTT